MVIATKNIQNYHYESHIETRQGYGLDPVEKDVDFNGMIDTGLVDDYFSIVIAGMGGRLIADILEQDKNSRQVAMKCKALIIQPNYAIELVREWLCLNGFDIIDEELCVEDKRYYNVIAARYSGIITKPQEIFYHLGKKLIEKKDPLLIKYINKKVKKFNEIIKEIQNNSKGAGVVEKSEDAGDTNTLKEIIMLRDAFECIKQQIHYEKEQ